MRLQRKSAPTPTVETRVSLSKFYKPKVYSKQKRSVLRRTMQKEVNSFGLDSQQVLERVEKGLVNGDQNVRTKTVRQILKTNVFTFFNLLFLIISAILWFFIPQNSNGYMQFTFMLLVIFNTSIG